MKIGLLPHSCCIFSAFCLPVDSLFCYPSALHEIQSLPKLALAVSEPILLLALGFSYGLRGSEGLCLQKFVAI
jgi:Golgi nucleoside diphosphatase